MIYFDHASTTPVVNSVLTEFTQELVNNVANASSSHRLGLKSRKKIDDATERILKTLLGKKYFQLFFTSSASESNSWIASKLNVDHIFYSKADHPSSVQAALAQSFRAKIHELPLLDNGRVDNDKLIEQLNSLDGKKLVMVSWVNSQTGSSSLVCENSKKLKNECDNLHIHIDAVQAVSRLFLDLDNSGVDSLTLSGHKIGAPQGVAALILRKGIKLDAMIYGGGQQDGARSSTEPTALILSLAAALELPFPSIEKALKIRNEVVSLLKDCPFDITFPFSFQKEDSPYLLSFVVNGVPSDLLLRNLEQRDIILSSTSSCSSKKKFNPQLSALGLSDSLHGNLLRFSSSPSTTASDLEVFAKALNEIYKEISFLL